MRYALATLVLPLVFALSGCGQGDNSASSDPVTEPANTTAEATTPAEVEAPAMSDSLATILEAQPEAVQARYAYRHPQETLEFFGIEPGMTIGEALPGGGWYTKILYPVVQEHGEYYAAIGTRRIKERLADNPAFSKMKIVQTRRLHFVPHDVRARYC